MIDIVSIYLTLYLCNKLSSYLSIYILSTVSMQNLCHSCKLFKTIFVENCLLKQMIKIHRFLSLRQNNSSLFLLFNP